MTTDPTAQSTVEKAIRETLSAAIPNSGGVIWEHEHEDGQREPVTIDGLTRMVMRHITAQSTPTPAPVAVPERGTNYVAGFLFDLPAERVALVRKNRPEWQAGHLNGIGGHIESGETAAEAMRREFIEETGLDIDSWDHFATVQGEWGSVAFFRAWGDVSAVRTMEDEEILVLDVREALASDRRLPNLSWLLPLALYRHDDYQPVVADERSATRPEPVTAPLPSEASREGLVRDVLKALRTAWQDDYSTRSVAEGVADAILAAGYTLPAADQRARDEGTVREGLALLADEWEALAAKYRRHADRGLPTASLDRATDRALRVCAGALKATLDGTR